MRTRGTLRVLAFATLALFATFARSDPVVFGLALGQTTEAELEERFAVIRSRAVRNGSVRSTAYLLDLANFDLRGLKRVEVEFDESERLVSVLMTFQKHRFDDLGETLAAKYRLVEQEAHPIGHRKMAFEDGDTSIYLLARRPSLDLSLEYIDKVFLERVLANARAETARDAAREQSEL